MYPKNQECDWLIVGPVDHTLTIQFRDLHLPGLRNCEITDHIYIGEKIAHNDSGKNKFYLTFAIKLLVYY